MTPPFSIAPVLDLARRMGDEILRIREEAGIGNGQPHPEGFAETKADDSPVSKADKAAHRLALRDLPKIHRCPVLSEEGGKRANLAAMQSGEFWIVDPLDGTSPFLKGSLEFAVLLAYVKDGVPQAGVVYFPAKNEFYFTGDDGKAYKQISEAPPEPLPSPRSVAEETLVFTRETKRNVHPAVAPRSGKHVEVQDLSGPMKYIDVLEGRAHGCICGTDAQRTGSGKYDLAAFDAIGRAIGIHTVDFHGHAVNYRHSYDPVNPIKAPAHLFAENKILQDLGMAPHSRSAAHTAEPLWAR